MSGDNPPAPFEAAEEKIPMWKPAPTIRILFVSGYGYQQTIGDALKRYLLNVPGINIVSRVLQAAGKIERRLVHFHYKDRSMGIDITIMDWDMV
jgi:hypothetical protein